MPNFPSRTNLLTVLMASALALVACSKAEQSAPTAPPAAVTVVTLQPEAVTLTRELIGRVEASEEAEVRPQVTGIVEDLLFTEGGSVEAGQPLYQLDQTAYRADADSARAAVARAQAALITARQNASRSTELVKIDAISRQEDETTQATLQLAEADLRAAEAALQGAKVPLGFTRITAPISGRIGRSSVTRGALVTGSQSQALAQIQQLDPVYVEVSQSSAELLQLRRGLQAGDMQQAQSVPVTLTLEDGSRYAEAGELRFAEATVDPATGAVAMRIVVANPDQLLLPGMFVRATVANAERRDAILAPQQGITRNAKGEATALVVDADSKAALRDVQVSRAIGDQWLIESGLEAGDRLIVEGLQKIAPGAPVNAVEATAVAATTDAEAAAGGPATAPTGVGASE
ncbi:MAG: efflux RND transporter periplasmic adaptor subunit [Xanthomonadales bacterium]|nr:efflux RND transporter periplasmic adaptor subunit [Xanthomonadales bacterium]